jgi:hypothetical protein
MFEVDLSYFELCKRPSDLDGVTNASLVRTVHHLFAGIGLELESLEGPEPVTTISGACFARKTTSRLIFHFVKTHKVGAVLLLLTRGFVPPHFIRLGSSHKKLLTFTRPGYKCSTADFLGPHVSLNLAETVPIPSFPEDEEVIVSYHFDNTRSDTGAREHIRLEVRMTRGNSYNIMGRSPLSPPGF